MNEEKVVEVIQDDSEKVEEKTYLLNVSFIFLDKEVSSIKIYKDLKNNEEKDHNFHKT